MADRKADAPKGGAMTKLLRYEELSLATIEKREAILEERLAQLKAKVAAMRDLKYDTLTVDGATKFDRANKLIGDWLKRLGRAISDKSLESEHDKPAEKPARKGGKK